MHQSWQNQHSGRKMLNAGLVCEGFSTQQVLSDVIHPTPWPPWLPCAGFLPASGDIALFWVPVRGSSLG